MIKLLKKKLQTEEFIPSFLGIFINPFYICRKRLYEAIVINKHYVHGNVLDFGCGCKPYKDIFQVEEYVGMDIEVSGHSHKNENVDIFYDGNTIPCADNYFDSIFSSEVLEHVFNIDKILTELYRVLKPNAYMVITVPFVWDEHEEPYDFGRYSSFGIDYLFKKTGFEVISINKTGGYIQTVFQLWSSYLYQILFPKNKYLKIILTAIIISPITILSILLSKILPKSNKLYLDNVIVVKK